MAVAADPAETGEAVSSRPGAGRGERVALALEANVFTICALGALCILQTVLVRGAVIPDSWYSLLAGREIARSGLPHHDTLTSLSLGRPWIDQQWLAQLSLYVLWRAGAWQLTAVSAILLYTGAFAVTAAAARRAGASDRSVAVVAAVCFCAGLPNASIRAQLFAYALFALVLALLLADARRPARRTLLVLPLLVLWANVHGSVVLGALLVAVRGLTFGWSSLRAHVAPPSWIPRAASLVVLPWLCALASPYALHLPSYYRSLLDNPTLAHSVAEWGPSSLRGQPFFFVALLAALWLGSRWSSASTPFAQLVLWLTGLAGLLAIRNQVWFALAAAAVVPAALDAAWQPALSSRRRGLNLGLVAVLLVAVAAMLGRTASRATGWFEESFPRQAQAAVAQAADRTGVGVFANERYADWLLFVDPRLRGRVAYDVRLELLDRATLRRIVDFRNEHGVDWQRAADRDRLLVLDPAADRGAVRYYRSLPGSAVLYRDPQVVVIRRGTPQAS